MQSLDIAKNIAILSKLVFQQHVYVVEIFAIDRGYLYLAHLFGVNDLNTGLRNFAQRRVKHRGIV